MIRELDAVVLTHDLEDHSLKQGNVVAVVQCYSDGEGFEVEFVTAEGKTIGLLTLKPDDIRPMKSGEMLHVREFAPV